MLDDILMTGIVRKGENVDDPAVIAKYASVAEKPVVLMSPPSKVVIKHNSTKLQCGLAYDFINVYKRFADSPIEMGKLEMGPKEVMLDPDVYYVLKGLAYLSLNKSENKASACREVFLYIVSIAKVSDMVSKGKLYDLISEWKPDGYYINELLSAIRIAAFGTAEGQYYFSKKCEMNGYYMDCYKFSMDYALKHFETPKEVDQFVLAAAKQARADKEFMKTLKKKTCKYLYGMMYAFKDEHPEILREFPQEKGFL